MASSRVDWSGGDARVARSLRQQREKRHGERSPSRERRNLRGNTRSMRRDAPRLIQIDADATPFTRSQSQMLGWCVNSGAHRSASASVLHTIGRRGSGRYPLAVSGAHGHRQVSGERRKLPIEPAANGGLDGPRHPHSARSAVTAFRLSSGSRSSSGAWHAAIAVSSGDQLDGSQPLPRTVEKRGQKLQPAGIAQVAGRPAVGDGQYSPSHRKMLVTGSVAERLVAFDLVLQDVEAERRVPAPIAAALLELDVQQGDPRAAWRETAIPHPSP